MCFFMLRSLRYLFIFDIDRFLRLVGKFWGKLWFVVVLDVVGEDIGIGGNDEVGFCGDFERLEEKKGGDLVVVFNLLKNVFFIVFLGFLLRFSFFFGDLGVLWLGVFYFGWLYLG